ncbi:MAG TPA: hypothetical protein VD790_07910 [Thermoleophilaceae bacterium]|nr:hypothetical protein [Thermoleophilaceae bacterium]
MLARFRGRLTYANVMATMALFIALGGGSYAAIKVQSSDIAKNAVRGKHVKKDSLTGKDIKNIKTGDVSNGTLLPEDFGSLPTGGPPTGDAGGDLAGTYPNPRVASDAIGGGKLAPDAVSTSKLADDAVGTAKINDGAVTTDKLDDAAVTTLKIADGAVTATQIAAVTITGAQIADGAITTAKVENESLLSEDIKDDTVAGGGLIAEDLRTGSVGQSEIQTDGVAATEVADNSIDSGEIVDFQLTNQDVSVLFAEVNADGTLANQCAGCGVSAARVGAAGAGTYSVDFGRNIATTCTAVGTLGTATTLVQRGEITVVDRDTNVEAVFVETNNSAGANADLAFRVVVVC